jgi:hypothetical protein
MHAWLRRDVRHYVIGRQTNAFVWEEERRIPGKWLVVMVTRVCVRHDADLLIVRLRCDLTAKMQIVNCHVSYGRLLSSSLRHDWATSTCRHSKKAGL